MKHLSFISFTGFDYTSEQVLKKSRDFYELMDKRRSLRVFSDKPVDKKVIENIIMTASSAPSGAHKQPWFFSAVSSNELKNKIRVAAEKEEYENYTGRMSDTWLKDLEPFDTGFEKPFLEIAPWLIVVFKKPFDIVNGEKKQNYYVNESVGIAVGFLLTAIHHAGLVALTHTPSPMNFLEKLLKRPPNERAYLLIPVGYPTDDALIPDIKRKELKEVADFL
ncbi:MAG: nitroreductase family protein [Bacteroidetes bacterium]|nr:MAG: nitroreductase family protein [Bacteroidota bacterium]